MRKGLLLLFMFLSSVVFAQKNSGILMAEIVGKEDGEALTPATLQLFTLPDSVFKVGAVSDPDGKINLKVQPGNYFMRLSFVGYVTIEKDVKIEGGKPCDLGKVVMKPSSTFLDEATVSAEVPPVTAAEDTLVFNTAAFRVPEGSMLEELIKKYPGVDIADDGTIKINGKTVNRILMKGKDFFGTDKDVALKNISVDAVDKVKFYDKKSDFTRMTGIDDGEEETVLDLQMKKGVTDGFFSNTDAGGGADFSAEHLLYRLRNTTSYYNDNAQYTLVLSANNVGDQGFSDGRGRGFGGFGGNGISSPKRAGFNFAYENEKIEFGGNVRGDRVKNDVKSWTATETFMPQIDRNQFSNGRSTSLNGRMNLNANFRFEWKPDTMTNIILTPTVSYSNNDFWNESHTATFNENPFDTESGYDKALYGDVYGALDTIAVNRNENESLSMGENLSLSARLQVNRRLNKPGRNLTFRGNYSYGYSESESFSMNNVVYYQAGAGMNPSQKRYSTTPSANWNYSLSLSYTEPLLKNLFLQLNYTYNQSYNNSDRATYNFDALADYILEVSPDFTRPTLPADLEQYLDNDLSRFSTYCTQRHEAGVTFRYVTEKMNLNAGVNWLPQQTQLDYKYQGIDTLFTRKVLDYVSPNIRFRYKWSKQTTLNIRYRGSTSHPSMTDLIDITDDSNPLNITKGNPGLKPSFSNNVNANFNTFNTDAQRGINVFAGYSNTINAITRKATYDEVTGATTTQPENINGNWNVNGGFVFNSAIPANTKFTYSTFTDGGYSERVSFISMQDVKGSVKSIAKTVNVSERLTANYRADNFDISLNGFVRYSHSKSSAQPEDKMNVFNFSYGPSVNYTLPWHNMKISTNLSMSSRRGYSDPNANTDELLWNAQLSASFLSKNALTVSLQLFDILQQQSNISRVVEALYRRDSESNAIYSYGMLNLSYKFNNTGGDSKKGKGAREYGMPEGMTPPPGMVAPPAGMRPPAGMMPPMM